MLITLVLCWTVVCLLLGDATDEVRMIAVSSTASTAEEQLPDACISEDDVVALFDALKLKISSSPDKRVSDSESLGLVFCIILYFT